MGVYDGSHNTSGFYICMYVHLGTVDPLPEDTGGDLVLVGKEGLDLAVGRNVDLHAVIHRVGAVQLPLDVADEVLQLVLVDLVSKAFDEVAVDVAFFQDLTKFSEAPIGKTHPMMPKDLGSDIVDPVVDVGHDVAVLFLVR
jgi:hypothetical protein